MGLPHSIRRCIFYTFFYFIVIFISMGKKRVNEEITKQQVRDIVKGEIDKHNNTKTHMTKTELKKEMQDFVNKELDKFLKDNRLKKFTTQEVKDLLVKFYQTLWIKKSFWTNSIK